MKLTATMFLTVDGVYQGPGGPDEDRRGGFERGGWVAPHFDEEGGRFMTSVFERADALLLGRRTWQIFEGYWPHHDGGDPISHGINVLPKHVPSTTLKDPTWQNTHVIEGDVEAAVRELKAKPGRELQVHGSGAPAPLAARARPRRRAQPAALPRRGRRRASALPGARPDARPDAGRVAVDAVRRDDPDLSTGRPRDLRDHVLTTQRLGASSNFSGDRMSPPRWRGSRISRRTTGSGRSLIWQRVLELGGAVRGACHCSNAAISECDLTGRRIRMAQPMP